MVKDPKLEKYISFIFRGNPMTPSIKLNEDNYVSWLVAIEVWFKSQDVQDHLTKQIKDISESNQLVWKKLDA